MKTLPGCLHATLEAINDTKKRIVISAMVKVKVQYGRRQRALGARGDKLVFFRSHSEAWNSVNSENKEAGIRVTHCMIPVAGRLEDYNRKNKVPGYSFTYLVRKTDGSLDILCFKPLSKDSNLPPPMTSPEVPSNPAISNDPRLPVPVVDSNQATPNDLWQTASGAYGQELSTSTASEGSQQNLAIPPRSQDQPWGSHNLDISPATQDPPWGTHNWDIPPASHHLPWGGQNSDIPPASQDPPLYSRNLDIL
jgi:hypothetical protein